MIQLIYFIASIDFCLLSAFYLKLNRMGSEYIKKTHSVAFYLKWDYILLILFIYLAIAIVKSGSFEIYLEKSPTVGRFIDRLISLILLLDIFLMVFNHWPK